MNAFLNIIARDPEAFKFFFKVSLARFRFQTKFLEISCKYQKLLSEVYNSAKDELEQSLSLQKKRLIRRTLTNDIEYYNAKNKLRKNLKIYFTEKIFGDEMAAAEIEELLKNRGIPLSEYIGFIAKPFEQLQDIMEIFDHLRH